jgi:hypothetical protein
MKTFFLFATLCLSSLITFAQSSETRTIEPFSKIKVSGVANVHYTPSDSTSLRISGSTEDLAKVFTKTENGVLTITTKGEISSNIKVEVSNKNLTEVLCDGAASFKSTEPLKADTLTLSAGGAAKIKTKVDSKALNVHLTGAGEVAVEGTSPDLNVQATGASSFRGYNLQVDNAEVTTSGAASARVNVNSKLKARATGASSIRIQGNVKNLSAESTTGASISRVPRPGSETKDSIVVKWNDHNIGERKHKRVEERVRKGPRPTRHMFNWAGFSVGVNGLVSENGSLIQPAKYRYLDLDYQRSYNLQLNPFQYNFHIYKNYLNLVTGIGIEWRRYMFENKTILNPDTIFTHGIIDTSGLYSYDKSILKSSLLQIPLLLEFNSGRRIQKSFHAAAGVIGQFLLTSKSKRVLERKGDEITIINNDNFNMSPFQVKMHVSVGYSYFTMFGEYNLTPLFNYGRGPVSYPFVMGIRLVPFMDFD